jgi:hypothetical protein
MLHTTELNPGFNHLWHFLGLCLDTPDEQLTETCCNNYFHCSDQYVSVSYLLTRAKICCDHLYVYQFWIIISLFVVETNSEDLFIKIHQLTLNVWCFNVVQNIFLCHNSNLNFEYGVSNSFIQNTFITRKSLCTHSTLNVGNYSLGKEIPYCTESNRYTLSWISFVQSALLHLSYSWFPDIWRSITHTHKCVHTV